MGSIRLNCPLCCNETFPCHKSLRYHLLSIIDNLICPACNKRHDDILALAEHLDQECGDDVPSQTTEGQQEHPAAGNLHSNVSIKIEKDEFDEKIANSILAKALLDPVRRKNMIPNSNDMTQNEENDNELLKMDTAIEAEPDADQLPLEESSIPGANENELYFCSGCAINFSSVEEHIRDYHEGQEVLVEENVDQQQNTQEEGQQSGEVIELSPVSILSDLPDGATVLMEGNTDNSLLLTDFSQLNQVEDTDDDEETGEMPEVDKDGVEQVFNTIREENCVDKDGREYTRKVVQIEKFWVKKEQHEERVPVIQRYVLSDDGNFRKATEEELAAIVEKGQVLDMFQCSKCLIQFSKIKQYEQHECNPETGSYYKCIHCPSLFNSNRSLRDHMMIHGVSSSTSGAKLKGPFLCKVCDTEFPTNKSLRLHRRMHDPIKAKSIEAPVSYSLSGETATEVTPLERVMFKCNICNVTLDKSYEEIHMEKHSLEKQYNCDICNRKFFTSDNLEMHMRVHNGEKTFSCSNCKKIFPFKDQLIEHMTEHCNSRPYQCQYCGRRFARPHEKVKHERIHTGEKPHECEICGKSFRVSYCLTLHMRTHSGYRPYVCQHCGKRFKAHSVYNHHLLTHSEERNYKCPFCPKAFKTGVQLAGHKNSHTKPFSCTECNRPFASLYAVRAHMETHKRENNLKFNCYMCGASYARAFALRDHIKEQHGDEATEADTEDGGNYEMIEEGIDATHAILPDNNDVLLVEMVGENMDDMSGEADGTV